jgi:hypothetical protein
MRLDLIIMLSMAAVYLTGSLRSALSGGAVAGRAGVIAGDNKMFDGAHIIGLA